MESFMTLKYISGRDDWIDGVKRKILFPNIFCV